MFICTWFDEMAAVDRQFRLNFYTRDATVELVDLKNGKVALKRIRAPEVSGPELVVGNEIRLYGRKYKIREFGD